MVYALCVLVPINIRGSNNLDGFDRLSASNVGGRSPMLWAHFVGAYLFTFGMLYLLYLEYQKVRLSAGRCLPVGQWVESIGLPTAYCF